MITTNFSSKPDIFIQQNLNTNNFVVKTGTVSSGIWNLTASVSSYVLSFFDERLLLLDGEKGTVACRVNYHLSHTLPRLSDDWTIECATRTFLRMSNLIALRGIPGSSMVGPCDYFGNLGQLDKYTYQFDVTQFPPLIQRKPILTKEIEIKVDIKLDNALLTTVKAEWIPGSEKEILFKKQTEYHLKPQHLRQSLFLDPGLLELETNEIELKHFDPRGIDLSAFKARLVNNNIPFQISQKPLASKDDFRVVTYRYEQGYANWQVKTGSGLFIEKHNFSQFMTPLTPFSKGFVVLAKFNDHPSELEMVGIQIPFGFTLIIEEGCIHGDSTLNGFYMMGMTSDHTTMRTADTVFLKDRTTKENVSMKILEEKLPTFDEPHAPHVLFKESSDHEKAEFINLLKTKSLICTPQNSEYRKILLSNIYQSSSPK